MTATAPSGSWRATHWNGLGPATALAVSATVTSATSGSFAKSLLGAGWSVGTVTLLRMGLAATILAPVAVWMVVTGRTSLAGNLRGILVVGALGAAGTAVCYFNAVAVLPVGVAMMVLYTAPVMVLLWMWLRHGRRPDLSTAAGATTAIGGVVLVVTAMGVDTPSPRGMAWALAGAVCLASYFVCAAQVPADASPVVLAGAGLAVATATVGVLGLLGVARLGVGAAEVTMARTSMNAGVPIVLLAVVSTAYVYLASMASVRVLGARLSSFLGLIELLAAVVLAWVLLGEALGGWQVLGGLLVIGGVMLVKSDRGAEVDGSDVVPASNVLMIDDQEDDIQ